MALRSALALLLLLPACTDESSTPEAPTRPTAQPQGAQQAAADNVGAELDRSLAELAGKPLPPLPQDWQGTGVLEHNEGPLPDGAPPWAAVSAEVVERDGARILVASASAGAIRDGYLARSAAANRARAILARWTKSEHLMGSSVTEVWRPKGGGPLFARVEMRVPNTWQPGDPLPTAAHR